MLTSISPLNKDNIDIYRNSTNNSDIDRVSNNNSGGDSNGVNEGYGAKIIYI